MLKQRLAKLHEGLCAASARAPASPAKSRGLVDRSSREQVAVSAAFGRRASARRKAGLIALSGEPAAEQPARPAARSGPACSATKASLSMASDWSGHGRRRALRQLVATSGWSKTVRSERL